MIGAGREFVFVLSGDASGIADAARKAQGALGDAAQSTTALDAAQSKANNSSDGLMGSLLKLGGGGYGLKKVADYALSSAQALVQAGISADRLNLQLSAATGAAQAGQELEYVRQVSNRLGLDLNTTAVSYARFAAAARGTSLEGRGVRAVFDSVSKSAAVMGLNVEESQGVLRSLEQMLSKGTVQAEELRGQLGDRLPGALQIAARAMGVTTGELGDMVQKGEVLATEFLPRFARQLEQELGGSAEKAANTMQAASNRASNAWELLKQTTVQSAIGETIKGQLNIASDGLNNISEAMQRSRDRGNGLALQLVAAGGAALQFINPLNAVVYVAQSAEGQMQQAKERLAELKLEFAANPYNTFLPAAIKDVEALVDRLERAKRAKDNFRALDVATVQQYEKQQEEATARRRAALKTVTEDLNGENTKLAKTLKVLAESFKAGDIAAEKYEMLVKAARATYGPKGAKEKKPEPLVDYEVLDSKDARAKAARLAAAADEPLSRFMTSAVQASDERLMAARERQLEQATSFAQQLVTGTDTIYAELIPQAEARGRAMLAIERSQLTARLAQLKLEGDTRRLAEDEIARYMLAREAQLTEELKPEWQRRLEAWGRTTEMMRTAHNDLMLGIVEQGESAFTQWLKTGQNTTRTLVNYIADEFAKLAYRRYIAGPLASLADFALTALTGGAGGGGESAPAGPGIKFPGKVGGGSATGSNFIERDMLTILHKGEAVIPKAYNPAAGGRSAAGAAPSVVLNLTYNVPAGQSPASYAAALDQHSQRIKAEVAADMARPGRLLQRAAVAAQ